MRAMSEANSCTEPLSVRDLALVVSDMRLPEETRRRLIEAVRSDPRNAAQVATLAALARDAGFDPAFDESLWEGFRSHELFDRLARAEGWEHPAEVLDAEGELEPYFRELLHVAEARVRRADEPGRLVAIREKLERAWAQERAREALISEVVEQLLEQQPDVAEQLLQRLAREYRARSAEAEPQTGQSVGGLLADRFQDL